MRFTLPSALRVATTAVVAAAVVLVPTAAQASASASGQDVSRLASLIARVAPHQGRVLSATVAGDGAVARFDSRSATVPFDPSDPVVLEASAVLVGAHSASSMPAIRVSLPRELRLDRGVIANDGTMVYQDSGGASAAVQVLSSGDTRFETVIPSAALGRNFTYDFGAGVTPVLRSDGGVDLTAAMNGVLAVIGQVAVPWAVDASGQPVSTSYRVVDGSVVQTVQTDVRTTYPVVADPSVTYGWARYVTYSKSEVRTDASWAPYTLLSVAVCEFISGSLGTAFCIVALGGSATSILQTFQNAAATGKCVQFSQPYYPSAVTFALQLRWKAISC